MRLGPAALEDVEAVRGRGACDCGGEAEVLCSTVDGRGERKPSRLARAGDVVRIPTTAPRDASAVRLRFSLSAIAMLPVAVKVRVSIHDVHGDGRVEERMHRRLSGTGAWSSFEVEVSPETVALEIRSELPSSSVMNAGAAAGSDGEFGALIALSEPTWVFDPPSSPPPDRPDILLYTIDTLRSDHTSLYGYARETTPWLDARAREGLVFLESYSTAPWTKPSTASLLTGHYPRFHGAHGKLPISPAVETLPEWLRRRGYRTYAVVANGNLVLRGLGFERGFDRFVLVKGEGGGYHAQAEKLNDRIEALLPELERPFFLYVHSVDPHSPYSPEARVAGRFTDSRYAGPVDPARTLDRFLKDLEIGPADLEEIVGLYDEEILYQDAMLEALHGRLGERGLDDALLTIVTSDHGEEFLEHGRWEHGKRLYEEQLRVPLALFGPALPSRFRGMRVEAPVQSIDVAPTLATLLGDDFERVPGRDLLEIASSPEAPAHLDRPIFAEEIHRDLDLDLRSVRFGGKKLIAKMGRRWGFFERVRVRGFFDLEADPGEQSELDRELVPSALSNLLRDYPKELAARLERGEPEASPIEIDEETKRALEALGYAP